MKTFVRCGRLFTGAEDEPRRGEVLVFDDDGRSPLPGRSRRRRSARPTTG